MKGDFTRSTFRSKKHYKSVRMQQGRVQLDADWNEQADILLHRIETGTRDLLGQSGGTNASDGFRIEPDPAELDDFHISPGRYYVNGILCENEERVPLSDQPDRYVAGAGARDVLGPEDGYYLVYLDVWTRQITHLEDGELREQALGGADTTTRAKTVWQVRCEPIAGLDAIPPSDSLPDVAERIRASTGKLEVQLQEAPLVNQLYRIEIDQSGSLADATFKWSRDNGAVVGLVKLDSDTSGKNLSLAIGDRRFRTDDWVEIVSDKDELEGQPRNDPSGTSVPRFCRIQDIVSGKSFVLDRDHHLDNLADSTSGAVKIRRWDMDPQRTSETTPPVFKLQPAAGQNGWVELENGIQIQFTAGQYKNGDYWYVPVRVGSKIPETRAAVAADGVSHHIAHLAVVHQLGGVVSLERDLRRRYIPPGDDRGLMYAGGDGQVTPRGTVLPEPLAVYVTGYIGRANVVVRFSLPEGALGTLYSSDPAVFPNVAVGSFQDVQTDGDGMARCWWMPMDTDRDGVILPVTATLLESGDTETGNAIQFNAWLSNADQVVYGTGHNAGVGTVEEGLHDLYDQVTRLHHVSGDGQVASRGEPLPLPLVVELTGHTPANGHRVRFALPDSLSAGELYAVNPSGPSAVPSKNVDITTDAAGRATCYWRMPAVGSAGDVPPVTATLLLASGTETAHKVTFNAWLSDTDRVRYYLSERAKDALPQQGTQASLKQTLDNLYDNLAILHYVGGDGQSARPGEALTHPLRVRLGNGAWAAGDAGEPRVRFRITSAAGGTLRAGTGAPATEIDGALNGSFYQCTWTLGDAAGPHEVEAFVYFEGVLTPAVTPLRFTAHVLASGEVMYDNPEHNASVHTVEHALDDLYDQVTRLHHVSGDGQVASRGDALPLPLIVELTGHTPASGHRVRFALPDSLSAGELYAVNPSGPSAVPSKDVEIITDAAGRATCYWRMPAVGSAGDVPPVTATLLLASGTETDHKVTFNAWLSDTDRVRYYLSERAKDARPQQGTQASLKQTLDNLYDNLAILHYVGGDGQSARPGEALTHPLRVRLGNGAWAAGDAGEPRVRFRITSAAGGTLRAGTGTPAAEIDGVLSGSFYQCTWTLGDAAGPHEVEAFVYFEGVLTPAVTPLRFTAQVLASGEVMYDNPEHNAGVQTVAHALDDLYEQVTSFHLVSGDGQVASRGEVLPLPLVVALTGHTPASVWGVRFALTGPQPAGALLADQPSAPSETPPPSLDVPIDAAGRAECYWLMPPVGSTADMPSVTATLLGPDGTPTVHMVAFHAWLSDADKVRYYLSERAQDAMPTQGTQGSLKQMLDNVYQNLASLHQDMAILHYVGGDGQSGPPDQALPHPLRVRLGNGAWAAGAPRVQFRIATGATGGLSVGDGDPIAAVDGALIDGIYQCTWTLGAAAGPHEVEAFVSFDGDPTPAVAPLRFTAQVLASSEVMYETAHNAEVRTVADGLDHLYEQVNDLGDLIEQVTRLHLVSGDGQVASRGQVLPLPLVVEFTGHIPPAGRLVRFTLPNTDSVGELHQAAPFQPSDEPVTSLELSTDAAGRAACYWRMPPVGSTGDMPTVTATLLDSDGAPTGHEVTFNAWLSDADQVRYTTERDGSVQNVEAGLDHLYEQVNGLGDLVEQVNDLGDLIEQVTRLHLVSGDGQVASRGQVLPLPLVVEFTGHIPPAGRLVRFTLPNTGSVGELHQAAPSQPSDEPVTSLELSTDATGRAACYWRMPPVGSTGDMPAVTATLLDSDGNPTGHEVTFNAWLSDADRVRYTTEHDGSVQNVEAGLDHLYGQVNGLSGLVAQVNDLGDLIEQVTRLHLVSGDGQVASRGQVLPLPLVVEFTGHIPEAGRQVRFTLPDTESVGELHEAAPFQPSDEPITSLEITTDAAGRAACYWRMPPVGSTGNMPTVTATLLGSDGNPTGHEVTFNAGRSEASAIHYDNPGATTATTVKAALDELFSVPLPVGAIVDYASRNDLTPQSVPRGFLRCDGGPASKATYAALYALIGDAFGEGDNSNFALPEITTEIRNLYKLIKY